MSIKTLKRNLAFCAYPKGIRSRRCVISPTCKRFFPDSLVLFRQIVWTENESTGFKLKPLERYTIDSLLMDTSISRKPRWNGHLQSYGTFHLPELAGQTIPMVMRISLLINTIQPDQSNPKYCARRRWFFSQNSLEKADSFICLLTVRAMVQPASSDKIKFSGCFTVFTVNSL